MARSDRQKPTRRSAPTGRRSGAASSWAERLAKARGDAAGDIDSWYDDVPEPAPAPVPEPEPEPELAPRAYHEYGEDGFDRRPQTARAPRHEDPADRYRGYVDEPYGDVRADGSFDGGYDEPFDDGFDDPEPQPVRRVVPGDRRDGAHADGSGASGFVHGLGVWFNKLIKILHLDRAGFGDEDQNPVFTTALPARKQLLLGDGSAPEGQDDDTPAAGGLARREPAQGMVATGAPTTADKMKFSLLIAIIVVLIGLTIMIMPKLAGFMGADGREQLQQFVQNAGPLGVIVIFALEVLQVVVAFIPGGAVEVVAGALYGTVGGGIIVVLGSVVSAMVIFILVRKLGAPFVQKFVSERDMKRMSFLQDASKLNTLVFVLYLIPGLPKDVFTYLVPLTPMRARDFFILSTLGRVPAVFASTYMGASAASGNFVRAIIVFIVIVAIAVVGLVFRDRFTALFSRKER